MNILLIGIQGSGKGTLVDGLKNHIDFDLISTGQLLRDEVATGSELGKIIAECQNSGNLVSLDIVLKTVKNKLNSSKKSILIFDGFPRDLTQANELDKLTKIDLVVNLNLSKETAIERLLNRLTCKECGYVSSMQLDPDRICPKCGGELIVRADENMESINKRFEIFYSQTLPILEKYRKDGVRIVEVDGNLLPEERLNIVLKVLNERNN